MLEQAMSFLAAQLNAYLVSRFPGHPEIAVASGLCTPDGTLSPDIQNKMVITLINVERETVVALSNFTPTNGNGYARGNPPLYLNLYVLVSASFPSQYATALQLLGRTLGYFQGNPNFDAQNSVNFPTSMNKLSVELVNLNLTELSTLWSTLGVDYMPSVLYKIRMLSLQEAWMSEPVPAVTGTEANVA